MKVFGSLTIAIAVGSSLLAGTCFADITIGSTTGTSAALLQTSEVTTDMDGYNFPTAVLSDSITSLSSSIAFAYTPPA